MYYGLGLPIKKPDVLVKLCRWMAICYMERLSDWHKQAIERVLLLVVTVGEEALATRSILN